MLSKLKDVLCRFIAWFEGHLEPDVPLWKQWLLTAPVMMLFVILIGAFVGLVGLFCTCVCAYPKIMFGLIAAALVLMFMNTVRKDLFSS